MQGLDDIYEESINITFIDILQHTMAACIFAYLHRSNFKRRDTMKPNTKQAAKYAKTKKKHFTARYLCIEISWWCANRRHTVTSLGRCKQASSNNIIRQTLSSEYTHSIYMILQPNRTRACPGTFIIQYNKSMTSRVYAFKGCANYHYCCVAFELHEN